MSLASSFNELLLRGKVFKVFGIEPTPYCLSTPAKKFSCLPEEGAGSMEGKNSSKETDRTSGSLETG
jgi:hypothetical protein